MNVIYVFTFFWFAFFWGEGGGAQNFTSRFTTTHPRNEKNIEIDISRLRD